MFYPNNPRCSNCGRFTNEPETVRITDPRPFRICTTCQAHKTDTIFEEKN